MPAKTIKSDAKETTGKTVPAKTEQKPVSTTNKTVKKETKVEETKNTNTQQTVKNNQTTKNQNAKTTQSTKSTNKETESKNKKVEPVIIVEDVSDDSDIDEFSESENESLDEKTQKTSGKSGEENKDKKLKKSWTELGDEWEKIEDNLKENEKAHKALLEQVRQNEKQRAELDRMKNKIYFQMSKAHDDEVKKARKEKPKRKGNMNGGFCKEKPVPLVLTQYLGLEPDVMLKRIEVMSMLNKKFKDAGLKNGQNSTLDSETAKALGKKEGRVIEFGNFQKFLKEFYVEEAQSQPKTNTVEM